MVGLALTATSSYADTKPTPLGTSVGKLAQKARSAVGSSSAAKPKTKIIKRSPAPQVKIRMKAKAAPVKRVVRKAAPVRSYRAPKAVRTVAKRAPRPATVRPRISNVQRKTATRPTVRLIRKATASKATQTKINNDSTKIIKSSVRKATTAKRNPSTGSAKAAQTPPVEAKAKVTVLRQRSVELAVTLSAVEVEVPLLSLPTVTLPPAGLAGVTVPRTDLPPVTLPPADPPTITLPPTDSVTVIPPGSRPPAAGPLPQVDQRAAPIDGTGSVRAHEETTRTRQVALAPAVTTMLTAYTRSPMSIHAWAMTSIGPPAVAILDDLGQRIRAAKVPDSVGPTATALVLAAAIGAAATGTAGSGSAGATGLAVLSTALRLPALGGSRRLTGRLRESAFGMPRLPGFSPD